MKVAVLTPLPPTKSGVAHYSSMLLPALGRRVGVRAFASLDGYRRADYDAVVYQLGNNPHHEAMYVEALREPGVVVLHDLVLHHLIVEMTLARGDASAYAGALEASHGAAGKAWAWGRAAGLHDEMGNFLLPASVEIAQKSKAVIVHNAWSRDRLRSFGVTTPIHLVPHPYIPETRVFDRDAIRKRYGFGRSHRVIGFFGFLTSAKRAEVVLEAFRVARARDETLALLIVGEPAPNIDVAALQMDGVVTTGYVSDEDFPSFYAAADRFVNLRYPTAGETSGTLIRAFDAGKPVAVSNYAQFAELPDTCAFKIPHGDDEVETLADFFLRDFGDVATAQREWLEANARLDLTIEGYLRALAPAERSESRAVHESLALFPELELVSAELTGSEVRIAIRNDGVTTIRTRTYGTPEYRLIATLSDGERHLEGRWLSLPRDLAPGDVAELTFPRIARGEQLTLRLHHALQDVPSVDHRPWAEVTRAG